MDNFGKAGEERRIRKRRIAAWRFPHNTAIFKDLEITGRRDGSWIGKIKSIAAQMMLRRPIARNTSRIRDDKNGVSEQAVGAPEHHRDGGAVRDSMLPPHLRAARQEKYGQTLMFTDAYMTGRGVRGVDRWTAPAKEIYCRCGAILFSDDVAFDTAAAVFTMGAARFQMSRRR